MNLEFTIHFVNIFFNILSFAIIARILLSWLRTPMSGPIFELLTNITQPILDFARKITPQIGMLDLSPIVALFGLDIIQYLILALLNY